MQTELNALRLQLADVIHRGAPMPPLAERVDVHCQLLEALMLLKQVNQMEINALSVR